MPTNRDVSFFHCSILKAKGATFSWGGPHDYSPLAILELDMGLSHLLSGYRSRVEGASPDYSQGNTHWPGDLTT